MRFIKQSQQLPVVNYDNYVTEVTSVKRHGDLLPSTIRAGICGTSGSGKTNVLLGLLTHVNGLRFLNIYIYSKSLQQAKYKYLYELIKPINELKLFVYDSHQEIIKPNEAEKDSVFIFDDVICSPQSEICEYFCMGRHNQIDSFYLTQTYSKIPKQLIRDNINFLILFKQDLTNLKHIYSDHVNTDMSFDAFVDMCKACWKKNRYDFLVIDKERELMNGRYRFLFDTFIIP